jgi:hypothetical protein
MNDFAPKGKDIFQCYFTATADPLLHKCKECFKVCKQDTKKGYQNLVFHVTGKHKDDYKQKVQAFVGNVEGAMDNFIRKISGRAKDIYGWMDWIIMENLSLRSCEKARFRKRSNLGKITIKTLKKFMKLTKEIIFRTIKQRAPSTFGLIIDGWSFGSDHYYAIFITWSNENTEAVEEYLIYFGVAEDIDEDTPFVEELDNSQRKFGFTAADWFDIICVALNDLFENTSEETRINADNFPEVVEFITADNCNTNMKLCNDARVNMKGCDSHKLHLSVVEMAGPEEKTDRNGAVSQHASALQVIISKIDTCMKELRKLTNAAKLRTKTRLRPEKRIRIRWSSLYNMLKKWNRIKRKVSSISDWPEVLLDSIPTQLENARMLEYTDKLAKFESVSKALQKSGDKRLNVYQSRVLLDKLITDYGNEFPLTSLRKDARIVQNKHFENGIYKIQGGLESTLTRAEEKAVEIFQKPNAQEIEQRNDEENYADAILQEAAAMKRRRTSASKYRCTNHVSPTTNIVERANSHGKLNMTDRRSHMHPETLQLIMILKLNKNLWPSESIIQEILDLQQQERQQEENSDEDEEESEGEESEDEESEDEDDDEDYD